MRIVLLLACITLAYSSISQKTKPAAKPAAVASKPSEGYKINIRISPLQNKWIFLYNHYGKYYQVVDSTLLNTNSEGIFKGNRKLPRGIYLVVTDQKSRLFDILMDDEQQFSIVADTLHPEKPVITGSKENTLYQDYARYLEKVVPKINAAQQQLPFATSKEDSARVQSAIVEGNKELNQYRDDVMQTQPNSMLAAFFNTMKKPEVPEMPRKADGSLDSTYPWRYVKDHFWDGVDFSNDALVRTPFFEPKLEEYFKYYVSPDADSIIPEVKDMLLYAREGKEMYRYLLAKFTNRYINPEIMGQDKVFVYLFENHYLKGDTVILSAKDKETIFKRGWSLIANQIGEPAPLLNLLDTTAKVRAMYEIPAKYTLIVFWDPNCGHCKEVIPQVDSIYQAKWKALGMKIYGVNVDESTMKLWKDFINKHNLKEWTHVYQPKAQRDAEAAAGQANFRQLYDVFKTPTLYLLDEQKRIIAKNLDVFGFDEVISAKTRVQKK